ncbi:MAG: cobalt ECF transporter T component CbiQ [Dehalococcoidia bacterium]|nr:cobalt ECF transporter T component CbiQ [Dehalococcoidia bacterium]
MKHSFIDQYSGLDSLVHRLDPRTKLLACLVFVLAVVLTPPGNWRIFACYFVLVTVLILLSRVPTWYVLKRSLVIFPFVIVVALFIPFFKQGQEIASCNLGAWHIAVTYEGIMVLVNVVIKAWLSILSLILLTSSTKLADTLSAMKQLGVPAIFILIISFMYRYIFVLVDQVMRMKQAMDSRNFGGNHLRQFKTLGNMIGILFIRSYERGERIYAAMLSRGYTGEIQTLNKFHFRPADAYFSAMLVILLVCPAILWW